MDSEVDVIKMNSSSDSTPDELIVSILPEIHLRYSKSGFESKENSDIAALLSMLEFQKAQLIPLFDDCIYNSAATIADATFNPSLYFRIHAPVEKLPDIKKELLSNYPNIIANVFNYQPVFSDPAVKLHYADTSSWSGDGSAGRAVNFDVNVRNESWMSNAGKVFLHYETRRGTWEDFEIPLYSRCGNYAVFRYSTNKFFKTDDFRFCIKFIEPNGTIHWDNNNNQNYLLRFIDSKLISGNVLLISADIVSHPMPNWMNCVNNICSGKLFVRDLSYRQNVGIRYSYDNGRNWNEASAHWVKKVYLGIQEWAFNLNVLTSGYYYPEFQLSAYYEDLATRKIYWDNNFNNNYRLRYSDNNSTVKHLD
jgi:hypothetical protein